MAINARLADLLGRRGARLDLVPHGETVTTSQAAQSALVPGRMVAKSVVLRFPAGRICWR